MNSSQVTNNIAKLKDLLKKLLIRNGFENSIPLAEKKDELRKVEYVLISIWVISSVLLLRDFQSRFLWFSLVPPAIIMEQVINLIYCWIDHLRNSGGIKRFAIKDALNRPVRQWFNIMFFVSFFVISLIPNISNYLFADLSYKYLYMMFSSFLGFMFVRDIVNKNKTSVDLYLSLGLGLLRSIKQLWSIINSGIGLVVPGVIVAFIAATFSQDLWLYISELSWVQIALISLLVLLFVLLPSVTFMKKNLDEEVRQMGLENNPFSSDLLYAAVIRRSSYGESKTIPVELFNEYSNCFSWKLLDPIYDTSIQELVDELKRRIVWRIWWSLVFLTPIILFFMFLVGLFLFPSELLSDWTGREIISPFSWLTLGDVIENGSQSLIIKWAISAENPIAKFSVFSTLLLLSYFVIEYSRDAKRVFSNLELNKGILNEWLIIICGFHVVVEHGFQSIVKHWHRGGHLLRGGEHVLEIVVPNNTSKTHVERLIPSVKDLYSVNPLLDSVLFIRVTEAMKSSTSIRLNLVARNDLANLRHGNPTANTACWVWANRHNSNDEVFEFANQIEAETWIKSR